MLNTKDMTVGTGKTKPVLEPGNQKIKVNSITLDQTPYDSEAYNLVLHVESEPIGGDFEGFYKDMNNQGLGRYAGQVGRVRYSPFAFKDTVLNNGREIFKDQEILKSLIVLSEVLGKRTELDSINASTITQFVESCSKLFAGTGYFNACINSREWLNKDGYVNDDLFLPRSSKEGIAIEALDVENSKLLKFDRAKHVKSAAKPNATSQPATAFEGTNGSGDDFTL